jgi:hypothetical protein
MFQRTGLSLDDPATANGVHPFLPRSFRNSLKLSLGLLFLSCAVIGWLAFGKLGVRHEQPAVSGSLMCNNPVWNVGTVDASAHGQIQHQFHIWNTSDKVVTIKNIRSTCGCLTAENCPESVPPGESITLPVKLVLPAVAGVFRQIVSVYSDNSPSDTPLELRIVGDRKLAGEMRTYPSKLNFGAVWSGQKRTYILHVERVNGEPVDVREVLSEIPGIQGEVKTNGAKRSEVAIHLDSGLAVPGRIESYIQLVTNHPQFREVKVPICAKIESLKSFFVDIAFIERIERGQRVDLPILSSSAYASPVKVPLEIEGVRVRGVGKTIRTELIHDTNGVPLVRVSRSQTATPQRVVSGTLVFELRGSACQVEIPISVFCAD